MPGSGGSGLASGGDLAEELDRADDRPARCRGLADEGDDPAARRRLAGEGALDEAPAEAPHREPREERDADARVDEAERRVVVAGPGDVART